MTSTNKKTCRRERCIQLGMNCICAREAKLRVCEQARGQRGRAASLQSKVTMNLTSFPLLGARVAVTCKTLRCLDLFFLFFCLSS